MNSILKREITAEGMLRLLNDLGEAFFPLTRYQTWKNVYQPKTICFGEYFPSVVKRRIKGLQAKGQVEVAENSDGWMVKITRGGKQELLKYDLMKFEPKKGVWDGKWRVVFFDVEEIDRKMRDRLRFYIKKLGLRQLQRSVWVTPYDVSGEVRYMREILKIPYDVRIGTLESIEYSNELKKWFKL